MIEVLKQMVEALEYWDVHGKLHQPTEEAIQAGKQAIAEFESKEPVAIVTGDAWETDIRFLPEGMALPPDTKLYTHPQRTWVGLTDEEFDYLRDNNFGVSPLISAVEAKLKEKNT